MERKKKRRRGEVQVAQPAPAKTQADAMTSTPLSAVAELEYEVARAFFNWANDALSSAAPDPSSELTFGGVNRA